MRTRQPALKEHPELAKKYLANYAEHRAHSKPYEWKAEPAQKPVGYRAPVRRREAARERTDDDGWVYIKGSGKRYHRENCRYAKGGTRISQAEAKRRGYTPCKVCKPE